MYEELQLALKDLVSPELLELLLSAQQTLAALGISAVDDEAQQILGLQEGIADSALLVARLHDLYYLALQSVLNEYGVRVRDEIELAQLVALVQTVDGISSYIDPEVLVPVAFSEEYTPEETLAQLVPYFTAESADLIWERLHSVHPRLITRIRQLVEENCQTYPPAPLTLPPDYAVRVRRLQQWLQRSEFKQPQLVYQLARAGFRCGSPLVTLLEQTLDRLDQLPPAQVAAELVGLLYFSDVPLAELPQAFQELVEDYTDSLTEQARIRAAAIPYLTEPMK